MQLITINVTLVVAGVVLWAINKYIPMAKPVKNIINNERGICSSNALDEGMRRC